MILVIFVLYVLSVALYFYSISFSAVNNLIAQQNFSVISATRTAVAPKIDGIPTDSVWVKTGVAFEFTQLQPNPNFLSTQKLKFEFFMMIKVSIF